MACLNQGDCIFCATFSCRGDHLLDFQPKWGKRPGGRHGSRRCQHRHGAVQEPGPDPPGSNDACVSGGHRCCGSYVAPAAERSSGCISGCDACCFQRIGNLSFSGRTGSTTHKAVSASPFPKRTTEMDRVQGSRPGRCRHKGYAASAGPFLSGERAARGIAAMRHRRYGIADTARELTIVISPPILQQYQMPPVLS